MPSAPRLKAAARPCPSANPPEAMNGTLSDCLALLSRMKFVISDSPTWPAHSKPSMERKSTPSLIADCACRIVVHCLSQFIGFSTAPSYEIEDLKLSSWEAHLVKNNAIRVLELLDHYSRVIASSLNYLDTFLNYHFSICIVIRRNQGREERQVDTEGVLGHRPASSDLFAEIFRSWLRQRRQLQQS